ncbi:hypothetical protein OYC64_010145 [Pagothenia borchgrevinki]|uniref:MHC class I antigen n=1 Tax=Pagothenia borchgrevinki TaxID=8213 RepID=A0ABD2H7U8_PAGBO
MTVKRNWVTDRKSFMSQFCGLLLHITSAFQWRDQSHFICGVDGLHQLFEDQIISGHSDHIKPDETRSG